MEGLDGSGKSTQIQLLQEYFYNKNIEYKYLHFPKTDESGIFGELISMFLRGEFGDLNNVHPYLVSLLYAGDRENSKRIIKNWLSNNYLVLIDRYVYSNIAFQCAKLENNKDKEKLKNWILNFEFNYYEIPKPSLCLFLDVPFEFTSNKLKENRVGQDREYLKGQTDIHEQNIDFQRKVKQEYLRLVEEEEKFIRIDCSKENDTILSADVIFQRIINKCKEKELF
ncbi:MAG: dTMP kinase [Bacteroidales bacterium]|nr:dTMP kinase [Bacteroidales bacterium]